MLAKGSSEEFVRDVIGLSEEEIRMEIFRNLKVAGRQLCCLLARATSVASDQGSKVPKEPTSPMVPDSPPPAYFHRRFGL